MKRLFLFVLLLFLFADASGVTAFVSSETCTSSTESTPDHTCPPLCVRCGCCAQPAVPMVAPALASVQIAAAPPAVHVDGTRLGSPHDILHVPR